MPLFVAGEVSGLINRSAVVGGGGKVRILRVKLDQRILGSNYGKTESESVSGRESEPAAPTGSHELDAFLGKAFDEKPIWSGLYESIRDMFSRPGSPSPSN